MAEAKKTEPEMIAFGIEGTTHDWSLVRLTVRGDKVAKREVLHAHDTKPVVLGKLVKAVRGG
jgi:hypothetical protein